MAKITLCYFINHADTILDYLRIGDESHVDDLLDLIYERNKTFFGDHNIDREHLDLYAPGNLQITKEEDLPRRVTAIIPTIIPLERTDSAQGVFRDKELNRGLVHLVVVPRSTVVERPIRRAIREKTTSTNSLGRTSKSDAEMDALVREVLSEHDKRLREYIAGPPYNNFWRAPESSDLEIARFINDLKIPQVSTYSALLLHDLGNGIVNQSILDQLFNGQSWFLTNTSGSGKTRLLFEGLSKHWGFYFVTSYFADRLGSVDLWDAIDRRIYFSPGFTHIPETLAAYNRNHSIAERFAHQMLTARVLVFEHFLKIVQSTYPDRPINEFKKHWLFLQLRSRDILSNDVFSYLSEMLLDASGEYLMLKRKSSLNVKLFDLQSNFGLDGDFYLTLDEAQIAMRKWDWCFGSNADNSVQYPVLRPIIKAWQAALVFPIIVSGIGLSTDVVNDTVSSAVGKFQNFTRFTNTGAFDDRQCQYKYIMRYMPRHVAESESGRELLRRAWCWVRGRHRFTASLVEDLLMSSFRSPHKVLNKYAGAFCGFPPFDAQDFIINEEDVGSVQRTGFSISSLKSEPYWIDLLGGLLFTWLIRRTLKPLVGKEQYLVEQGLARFIHTPEERAMFDEPFSLLCTTRKLWGDSDFSLETYVTKRLADTSARREHFAELIAYYVASAFDKDHNLCDIFDFGNDVPQWAKQRAELVSLVWTGKKVEANRFHLEDFINATTIIGRKCSTVEETIDWFERPSTLMCFPDDYMGPDVVTFVRLENGLILAVVIQDKGRIEDRLAESVQHQAPLTVSTVDPLNFYNHEESKSDKYADAKRRILEIFECLNGPGTNIEPDKWLEDGMPVLRVIAPYAQDTELTSAPWVSLKMGICEIATDAPDVLNAMGSSLGIKGAIKRISKEDPFGHYYWYL